MGFRDVMKRMIQGKPAFEVPTDTDEWDDDAPTADFAEERQAKRDQASEQTLYDEKGYKHPPIVAMTNVQCKLSHGYMELWVTIENQSDREVRLDKVTICGSKFSMNYPLHAHSQRVFQVYRGKSLTHDHYKKAELYYCDAPTGDYFRADHMIHYRYESDGTYEVVDFDLIQPIYDI